MLRRIFIIYFTVAVFAGLSMQAVAMAAQGDILPPGVVKTEEFGGTAKLPTANLKMDILPQLIKVTLALVGSVSFIVFVYAGIMLVISQGDEEDMKKFKEILIWSLVGLLFITTSYLLVRGVMNVMF